MKFMIVKFMVGCGWWLEKMNVKQFLIVSQTRINTIFLKKILRNFVNKYL